MALLPPDLPDGRQLVDQGLTLGRSLTLGRTLLCETHEVASEVDYKRTMLHAGRVTTAMNIGMQTWSQTAKALEDIHHNRTTKNYVSWYIFPNLFL